MQRAYGDEPPADLEGPRPEGELPDICDDWNPVAPGNQSVVSELVRYAVYACIIAKPGTQDPGSGEDWTRASSTATTVSTSSSSGST